MGDMRNLCREVDQMVGMVDEGEILLSKGMPTNTRFYSFDIGAFFKPKMEEMGGV